MLKFLSKCVFFLSVLSLAACFGGGHYAPVIERHGHLQDVPNSHRVVRGETLYSIAWRYNIEVRQLAVANGLASPYTIFPGQRLALKENSRATAKPKAVVLKPATKARTSSVSRPATKPQITDPVYSVEMNKTRYPFRWSWPAPGRIVTSYSASSAVHKGIDLHGKLGEPVHAANSGKVVYAGSGLVGYGKLLIIKHDEHYLSAYGHNHKMMVTEGDLVKVGQKIAEFGDTGTDEVKLHFEVRRDGKPVNPLGLLPAR